MSLQGAAETQTSPFVEGPITRIIRIGSPNIHLETYSERKGFELHWAIVSGSYMPQRTQKRSFWLSTRSKLQNF